MQIEQIPVEELKIRVLPDGRVSRADAATFLGVSAGTLANWSMQQRGPRPIPVAGRAYYFLRDLEAFRDTGARQAAAA